MPFAFHSDGREMQRPSSEVGIHIDGPLSAADLRIVATELLDLLLAATERETLEREKARAAWSPPWPGDRPT